MLLESSRSRWRKWLGRPSSTCHPHLVSGFSILTILPTQDLKWLSTKFLKGNSRDFFFFFISQESVTTTRRSSWYVRFTSLHGENLGLEFYDTLFFQQDRIRNYLFSWRIEFHDRLISFACDHIDRVSRVDWIGHHVDQRLRLQTDAAELGLSVACFSGTIGFLTFYSSLFSSLHEENVRGPAKDLLVVPGIEAQRPSRDVARRRAELTVFKWLKLSGYQIWFWEHN